MDFKNFAYSTIATAPVPANSGTSLTVATGDGSKFPTVFPFYVTIWPTAATPISTNAEIVKVTNITGDVFTIVRQQEGTSARSILSGDQIAATITAATTIKFRNLEKTIKTADYTATVEDDLIICNNTSAITITLPPATASGKVLHIKAFNTGLVTIDGDSSDTIDGETTKRIDQWDSMMLCDVISNAWVII